MTRRSSTTIALIATAACAASAPCLAQSATVRVTHNDPDGIVIPGQTVQITATVSWQGSWTTFWEIQGGVLATPNTGTASNNAFPYVVEPAPERVIQPGVPVGGSVVGVHIISGEFGWLLWGQPPSYPWGQLSGLHVVRFDWTAPTTPGVVGFDWIPSPTNPQISLVFGMGGDPPVRTVPTTYLGTSVTVIPAPAAALAMVLAFYGTLAVRRRH